jgi:hypothetical protein
VGDSSGVGPAGHGRGHRDRQRLGDPPSIEELRAGDRQLASPAADQAVTELLTGFRDVIRR